MGSNKNKTCENIGFQSFENILAVDTSEEKLLNLIDNLNQDNSKKSEVNSTIELSSSEDKAEEPGFWRGLAFN